MRFRAVVAAFSTLESGLRSETGVRGAGRPGEHPPFSTLESGLRSETPEGRRRQRREGDFQYPRIGPTK